AAQHNQRFQAHVPVARHAPDRRYPVLRRQGALAGGVLPYVQRAARGSAADRADLRPLSEGGLGARGAAEVALRLGPHGRDRAARARDERRDPDEQGRGRAGAAARGGRILHRAADPLERSRARGRAAPRDRERALHRPGDHTRVRERSAAGPFGATGQAGHGGKYPEDRGRLLQDSSLGLAVEAAESIDRAAATDRDGAREGADDAQSAGDRGCVRRTRPYDRAARVPAGQGLEGDGYACRGGLQQPLENVDVLTWTSGG